MLDTITLPEKTKAITEQTLLKETEKLARIGSWQYNYQTGKGKWSVEAYRVLGYEIGAVPPTFKSFLDRIHPEDLDSVMKTHNEIVEKNLTSQEMKHRIINFETKEVRHLLTKLIFERDSLGKPYQAMGFIQDITESKLAEVKLLQAQAHLVASQHIANVGSCEITLSDSENPYDCLISWSDETYRIFGVTPGKFIPTVNNYLKIVHPDDVETIRNKFEEVRKTGKNYNFEHRVIRPDNKERIVCVKGETFTNNITGQPSKIIVTVQDITERRREEEAFIKSEANLRTIFDNTSTLYVLVDRDLKIVSFNKTAMEDFKRDFNRTLNRGEDILNFVAADRKQRAMEMYQRVFEGEQFKLEDSYTFPDGRIIWYYMQLLPVYGENNKVLNMIIYLRDITEKKIAEIEREKITKDLIQRNKDLEQFSYIISHNLRLPVANILGLITNFTINKLPPHEQQEVLSAMFVSVRRLDDVVLDLNKILTVRNSENENKQLVSLTDMEHATKINLGLLIKKESVIIETDFSEIDKLYTIKSYMSSIFYNLVLNSINFRQPGLTPRIKITSWKKDNKIILKFSDNGMGIDLCKKGSELFGLYKRFHPHINGKGMGLYMVKAQVESLGGKISVESQVNKGTAFTIELVE